MEERRVSFSGDCSGVNPWLAFSLAVLGDHESCVQVVRSIHDYVSIIKYIHIVRTQFRDMAFHLCET